MDAYILLGICFICSIDVWLAVCTSENQLEKLPCYFAH